VDDAGVLHLLQGGIPLWGRGGLGLEVLFLATTDVAAGWPVGFGEGITDEQSPETVSPVCGLFLAQAPVEQD
jgi:hypothetical protein